MILPPLTSISRTESLILDLLASETRFGLDLVEGSQGRLKRGSVYVTLARMEAKALVESHQEARPAGVAGLPRRVYRATSYGLKVRQAYRRLHETLALTPAEAQP
jgi:DNA-binding PadR family transcriptional regulator